MSHNLFYNLQDGRWWHVKSGTKEDLQTHIRKCCKGEESKTVIVSSTKDVNIQGRIVDAKELNQFVIAKQFCTFYKTFMN